MENVGFDNEKYLEEQSAAILKRAERFGNKLYLEFGGKLSNDLHAARVLPGFDPNVKIKLLQKLRDTSEIIICIFSGDIERKKMRQDFGLAYETQILRDIDDLHEYGLFVRGVIITRYLDQPSVNIWKTKLERRGINVYIHRPIPGYPNDVNLIVGDEGYGKNEFIPTERPIVVVTAPGGGSGKLGTCLSQVYHENKRGIAAGYAKFETFPIWNLPLNHPVNIAYEASTADLGDINEVDPFHLEQYSQTAINYNRDIEIFPVVKKILTKIMGTEDVYQSPTDMGVNRAGFAITNDLLCQKAAVQEVIRRFYRYSCEYISGNTNEKTIDRVEKLMHEKLDITPLDRIVVNPARKAAKQAKIKEKGHNGIYVGASIALPDGKIVTSCNSALLHAASALVLNAIKILAGIPEKIDLISRHVLDSIREMKTHILNGKEVSLDLQETLIALSISATTNPTAELAMQQLNLLNFCDVHMTHMASLGDNVGLRKLGVNLTCDPQFATNSLFIR
ncbi:MAG: DUF1846 domain-containing protein [Promethearchaeota archaeon]